MKDNSIKKLILKKDPVFDDFHEEKGEKLVSFWCPRHRDIFLMAKIFLEWGCFHVLDGGCGYGFFSRLLSWEGLRITAIDIIEEYSHDPDYTYIKQDIKTVDNDYYSGIFISWCQRDMEVEKAVLSIKPRLVFYVIESNGLTGDSRGRYILDIIPLYRPSLFWDNVNYRDISSRLRDYDIKTSNNRIILFIRRDLWQEEPLLGIISSLSSFHCSPYPWEEELDRLYIPGEWVEDRRKTLWEPRLIQDEKDFLLQLNFQGVLPSIIF